MPVQSLWRLALLLALLPQLIVLGLGRGVVVCIAPSGHVQIEIAASACCAAGGSAGARSDRDLATSQDEPDCGSCADLQIAWTFVSPLARAPRRSSSPETGPCFRPNPPHSRQLPTRPG